MTAPTVTGTVYQAGTTSSVLNVATTTTVAAGLTLPMLVCIATNPNGNQPASADWLGTPMTSMGLAAGNAFKQAYYLLNPAPGTGSCTVTWNVLSTNISMTNFVVQNAGSMESAVDNGGFPFSNTGSQAITTAVNDDLLISMFWNDATQTQTQGAGQTLLSTSLQSAYRMTVASKTAPTAGAQSVGVTFGAVVDWDNLALAISNVVANTFIPSAIII